MLEYGCRMASYALGGLVICVGVEVRLSVMIRVLMAYSLGKNHPSV